ncbi:DUF4430 domain-containing protein [Cellulosilyticum sp. WCF-2]|nr:DUF4430 domain-containing protein [Cellulosilyticum sp. WCF-2]
MIFIVKDDTMENKPLLALAATLIYLSMCKHTSSNDECRTKVRINDYDCVTIEVLGPGGNSILMPSTTVSINENTTVLSASIDSFKQNQLAFQTGGSDTDMYITSIANLSQQSSGPLSGWLYKVNNVFIDASPSIYKLNPGDCVTWVYTTDLGKDVNAPPVIFERHYYQTSFNNFNFSQLK